MRKKRKRAEFYRGFRFFVDFCPRAFAYSAPRCYNGSGVNTDEKQLNTVPRMHYVAAFLRNNIVLVVALVAAAVSCCFVPPDGEYVGYFDLRTLSSLFGMSAVITAMKRQNVFRALADKLIKRFRTTRSLVAALVAITYLASMLIANDMALLTFLPLGFLVLSSTGKQKYMAFTFIMQNIAANLGGMLTPFGNPQNLYLYTKFNIPNGEFMGIMAPPFILSVVLITLCCIIFVKNEPLMISDEKIELNGKRTALYLALFALAIAIVFRGIPYWIGLIIIPAVLFFADRHALESVDYPLLFTFVFFFIFAGNMARMDAVRNFFSALLSKNTLLFSALSCQCISNVPSAILLSQFTGNYAELLIGVNVGGVGTLIASLASLITFREYVKHDPKSTRRYIAEFSAFNFGFLIILIAFEQFVMKV